LSKGSSLLSAAALVFVVTTFGRLLGFVRDLAIARYFGASADTDAFLIAWMIPETISPLLLDGAMIFVLVPLFARELEKEGTIEGILPRTLPPIAAVLLVISAVAALSAPWTVPLLAPGLSASAELSAVRMVGIASVTIFFIGLAGYVRAALNSHQIFGVPAAVYVGYNLGILGCILLLHEPLGIYSAALGLALGSALMLLVQVPSFVRAAGVPRLSLKLDRGLLSEFAAFVPVGAFVLGRHAQVYVERFLGSFLDPGAISQLNYATRLAQFPMFAAITVAIVSFPAVARAAAARRTGEVERAIESDLKMASTLILPATAYLILFAPELVAFLFERGAFTAEDTAATASILRIYSLGLLAQTAIYVVVRPFFTYRENIWTPIRATLIGLAVTIAVDVALLRSLGVDGLAAGNAAGISVMALLLIRDMKRRVVNVNSRRLAGFFVRAFGAVFLAAALALPLVLLDVSAVMPASVVLLLGGTILGLAYLFLGRLFGVGELEEIQDQARRALGSRE
jgi:putative peptidoglycan lipid II flippase